MTALPVGFGHPLDVDDEPEASVPLRVTFLEIALDVSD
jgi:hypothetical protein